MAVATLVAPLDRQTMRARMFPEWLHQQIIGLGKRF
jgi:hypothetical protein